MLNTQYDWYQKRQKRTWHSVNTDGFKPQLLQQGCEVIVMWVGLTMWHGRPVCSHVCCRSYTLQWLLYSLCPGPHRCNTSTQNRPSEENHFNQLPTITPHVVFCDMSKCTDEFCYLVVAIMGHRLENYGLHSWDIGKFYLRYVKCTYNMGPACKKQTENNRQEIRSAQEKVVCCMKIWKDIQKSTC